MDRIEYLEKRIVALEKCIISMQQNLLTAYETVAPPHSLEEPISKNREVISYTVGQAAEKLSVSDQTVRLWLRDGTLKGSKIGGGRVWRVTEESIQEFVKRG